MKSIDDSHGNSILKKARLVATSHGKYFSLGRQIRYFRILSKEKTLKTPSGSSVKL